MKRRFRQKYPHFFKKFVRNLGSQDRAFSHVWLGKPSIQKKTGKTLVFYQIGGVPPDQTLEEKTGNWPKRYEKKGKLTKPYKGEGTPFGKIPNYFY